jgi:recombination protein RecT|nr:MAG TPA: RecT protein [Caudoviricetes sp.]
MNNAQGQMVVSKNTPKFSVAIQTDTYKKLINNTLGDPEKAKRFIASISSAVATNPALQECDAGTILSGALLGEALNLSPSPVLGNYYLVPYDNKKKGIKEAQFQIGWKGYYQLAVKSGQYKQITVLPIKEGELIKYDPLNEEIEVVIIDDDITREETPTMGYYASFTYLNGFKKVLYWSKDKMMKHADKYSKAFNLADYKKLQAGQIPEKDMWKFSSPWYTMTDDMGCKTILKQLLSKYGLLSIEMQDAIIKDQAVIKDDGTFQYVDNTDEEKETNETDIEKEKKTNTRKMSLDDFK